MKQQQIELQRDLYHLLLTASDGNVDNDSILATALDLVVKLTGARIGYIEVHNAEGEIRWSAFQCDAAETEAIRNRISTGIIAEAIRMGETITTGSAYLDPRFEKRESVMSERIEAVLCSPFNHNGVTGVVYLQGDGSSGLDESTNLIEAELFSRRIAPLLHGVYRQIIRKKKDKETLRQFTANGIVGHSPLFRKKLREAMVIAGLNVTVLITGETGSGKGMLAKAIHDNSSRKEKPFIHLNCANLPEALAESELFGVVRGAHSSAYTDIKGKIAAAREGTLFLDEVGELPFGVQAKLLQFLEDGRFFPLGASMPISADVRVIAASNIDFREAIAKGRFREDLYYRLCVFPIEMPSLKQRREDIPLLVRHFIEKHCRRFTIPVMHIESSMLERLRECDWNGNIRELENNIQQAIVRALFEESHELRLNHLFSGSDDVPTDSDVMNYRKGKDIWEKDFIAMHLERHNWNISVTAKSLELSRSYLNTLIRIHNLERKNYQESGRDAVSNDSIR